MKLTKTKANLLLVLVTVAWGLGFLCVKVAINNGMSPAIINIIRGFIFSFLILVFFFPKIKNMKLYDFKIGLAIGIVNFLGFITQTVGAAYTTPSNSAFLSVTSVIMVPFLVWLFYGKRPTFILFISVIICLYGMAWLTGFRSSRNISNIGDILSLVCAFFFALSIAMLGNSAKESEFAVIAFMLGITQMIGALIYFLIAEKAAVPAINWHNVILPILFLGVGSSFLAQTSQVVAQKYTSASSAALIMTLEAVFASIFSVMFNYDKMSRSLIIGGALIMTSLLITKIDFTQFKRNKTKI